IIINNALDELEHHGDFESNCFDINCFEEADRVKIVFSDNGSGIDKEIIDNIFEPFVSAKEQGGIGIGLNIAQKIINEHKGDIRAYNRDGGAVIEVSLPATN
ncbi:MAG: ATP-binding protein, partial [Campylobacterota bacterium]|nr:ATP-binding protein [Campylobacterota bacterium]